MRAVALLRQAAEQGHPSALNQVGLLLTEGRVVPRNEAEAARNFRRAADQGHAAAQLNLAHALEVGRGVPRNLEEARLWFLRASDQGLPQAREALERIRQGSTITSPEITQPSPAIGASPGSAQSNPAGGPGVTPPAEQNPATARVDPRALDLAFWQSIQGSMNVAEFEAYLRQFPAGTFVALARTRIAAMRVPAAAPVAPASPPADCYNDRTSVTLTGILTRRHSERTEVQVNSRGESLGRQPVRGMDWFLRLDTPICAYWVDDEPQQFNEIWVGLLEFDEQRALGSLNRRVTLSGVIESYVTQPTALVVRAFPGRR